MLLTEYNGRFFTRLGAPIDVTPSYDTVPTEIRPYLLSGEKHTQRILEGLDQLFDLDYMRVNLE